MQAKQLLLYFNSIKVRLKHNLACSFVRPLLFQFHKGTIKTLLLPLCSSLSTNFNSIKVRLKLQGGTMGAPSPRHFNSIKVRLKRNNQGNINVDFNNFNSIKVRLKHNNYIKATVLTPFQFHKGTIKTCAFGQILSYRLRFQFHKGTIKTLFCRSRDTYNGISIP